MEWTLALGVLEQGLKLWNTKESRKYLDRIIKLKKEWYEALRNQDHNQLVSVERELRIIAESFVGASGEQNTVH